MQKNKECQRCIFHYSNYIKKQFPKEEAPVQLPGTGLSFKGFRPLLELHIEGGAKHGGGVIISVVLFLRCEHGIIAFHGNIL